jgi:hypothetical protein
MTAAYWEIGRRIVACEQGGADRAEYGEVLVRHLAADLSCRFGRGFGWRNLFQMKAFYLAWPEQEIVQTPSALFDLATLAHRFPLPWSAYVRLLAVRNPAGRAFYETEALRGGWSVRQLDRQIESQFYERTALSRDKATLLQQGALAKPADPMTPEEALKDPFVLEFLDLNDQYSESELNLSNKVLAAEYQTVLPDEKQLAGEMERTRRELEARSRPTFPEPTQPASRKRSHPHPRSKT